MRQLLIVSASCVVLLALTSCAPDNGGVSTGMPVSPDQVRSAGFPDDVAGVWKSDLKDWAFKFEPDGSILKFRHMLAGYVKVEEGGSYMEGKEEDTYALFSLDKCQASYDPETRILDVQVFLDDYIMKLDIGTVEGRSEDYFTGPVSQDGSSWSVNWRSYGWVKGADPPDPNAVEAYPMKLVFTKEYSQTDLDKGRDGQ
ncbi:MAG: hypothetical protein KAT00_10460 [Planctomycetes bacterium]|nr:hypothetical protein [Planctomycetota bacterium]